MSGAGPVDRDGHDRTAIEQVGTGWAEPAGDLEADPDADPDLHIVTERECWQCGDLVLILSSRDWCDACELDEPE